MTLNRRDLLCAAAGLPIVGLVRPLAAAPTPDCGGALPTLQQMAGPFARREVVERRNLRAVGIKGLPLRLTGRVEDPHCRPLQGCVLTFWQADADGRYDQQGGQLYGRQRSEDGLYELETVVPGRYPSRVPHLHTAIHDADGRLRLTTQLYFPGAAGNERDFLFNQALLMDYAADEAGAIAQFTFVVATG